VNGRERNYATVVIIAMIVANVMMMMMMRRNAVIALNVTVVQSIAIIAIAVMNVAIVGILMQMCAWETLKSQRPKSNWN
jgi:hypothetical protein